MKYMVIVLIILFSVVISLSFSVMGESDDIKVSNYYLKSDELLFQFDLDGLKINNFLENEVPEDIVLKEMFSTGNISENDSRIISVYKYF